MLKNKINILIFLIAIFLLNSCGIDIVYKYQQNYDYNEIYKEQMIQLSLLIANNISDYKIINKENRFINFINTYADTSTLNTKNKYILYSPLDIEPKIIEECKNLTFVYFDEVFGVETFKDESINVTNPKLQKLNEFYYPAVVYKVVLVSNLIQPNNIKYVTIIFKQDLITEWTFTDIKLGNKIENP